MRPLQNDLAHEVGESLPPDLIRGSSAEGEDDRVGTRHSLPLVNEAVWFSFGLNMR